MRVRFCPCATSPKLVVTIHRRPHRSWSAIPPWRRRWQHRGREREDGVAVSGATDGKALVAAHGKARGARRRGVASPSLSPAPPAPLWASRLTSSSPPLTPSTPQARPPLTSSSQIFSSRSLDLLSLSSSLRVEIMGIPYLHGDGIRTGYRIPNVDRISYLYLGFVS